MTAKTTQPAPVAARACATLVLALTLPRKATPAAAARAATDLRARGFVATSLGLDVTSQQSIDAAIAALEPDGPDLLLNNAGVSKTPDAHLPNGLDVRFATNHLGHFLLAHLLREQMAQIQKRLDALDN